MKMTVRDNHLYHHFGRVHAEVARQDDKWGIQNHTPCQWAAILGEEYGEACKELLEGELMSQESSFELARQELYEVAAVALQTIMSLDRMKLTREKEELK